jgi:hypothetical protein
MPGTLLPRTWQYDPALDPPVRYRRACRYDSFVPTALAALEVKLDAVVVGAVSEAEQAIRDLNAVPAGDLRGHGRADKRYRT